VRNIIYSVDASKLEEWNCEPQLANISSYRKYSAVAFEREDGFFNRPKRKEREAGRRLFFTKIDCAKSLIAPAAVNRSAEAGAQRVGAEAAKEKGRYALLRV